MKKIYQTRMFSVVLNTMKVTLGGRLYHVRAAVTRKERLPIVQSRVRGMIGSWREPELRCFSVVVVDYGMTSVVCVISY